MEDGDKESVLCKPTNILLLCDTRTPAIVTTLVDFIWRISSLDPHFRLERCFREA